VDEVGVPETRPAQGREKNCIRTLSQGQGERSFASVKKPRLTDQRP
jgi:hypothetical protein